MSSVRKISSDYYNIIVSMEERLSKAETELKELREFREHLVHCELRRKENESSSIVTDLIDMNDDDEGNTSNCEELSDPVPADEPSTENIHVDAIDVDNEITISDDDDIEEVSFVPESEEGVVIIFDDNDEIIDVDPTDLGPYCKYRQIYSNVHDLEDHLRLHRKRKLEETENHQRDQDNGNPNSKKRTRSTFPNPDQTSSSALVSADDNEGLPEFSSRVQKWMKTTPCNKFFDFMLWDADCEGLQLHRFVINISTCPLSRNMYSLVQEFGSAIGCLVICSNNDTVHIECSMWKIFQSLPGLKNMTLSGNKLPLNWTIPSTCPVPRSPITDLVISLNWNPVTERSFEFGHFLKLVAPNLKNISFDIKYPNLFPDRSSSTAVTEMSKFISSVGKLNVANVTRLLFLNGVSFIDSGIDTKLDYSPIFSTPFPNMDSFTAPAFYPNGNVDHALHVEMSLWRMMRSMPRLTRLNLKDVFLGSLFSITLLGSPTVQCLTCNELAFHIRDVQDFENNFPNLQRLVVWSKLAIFTEQRALKPVSSFLTYLTSVDETRTDVFLRLSHSKVKELKLSFNNRQLNSSAKGLLERFPYVKDLELYLMEDNYRRILTVFLRQIRSRVTLKTLILSGLYTDIGHDGAVTLFDNILRTLAHNVKEVPYIQIQNLIFESCEYAIGISPAFVQDILLKLPSLKNLEFSGIKISNFTKLEELLMKHNIAVSSSKYPSLIRGFCREHRHTVE